MESSIVRTLGKQTLDKFGTLLGTCYYDAMPKPSRVPNLSNVCLSSVRTIPDSFIRISLFFRAQLIVKSTEPQEVCLCRKSINILFLRLFTPR